MTSNLRIQVFTKDITRAIRVAQKLESGMVGINAASPTLHYDIPFGGWKQSGYGKEMGKSWVENWYALRPANVSSLQLLTSFGWI